MNSILNFISDSIFLFLIGSAVGFVVGAFLKFKSLKNLKKTDPELYKKELKLFKNKFKFNWSK